MLSVADSRPMARPKSEGNSPVMPAPRRHCSHWLSTTVWMCGHCATIWRQWKANSPLTASAGPVLDCCVVGDMGKMGQALATARLQPLPAPGKMAGTPGWSRLLHWAGAQLGHVRFLADWGSVRHEDYSNPSATSWVSGKHRHEDDTGHPDYMGQNPPGRGVSSTRLTGAPGGTVGGYTFSQFNKLAACNSSLQSTVSSPSDAVPCNMHA